MRRPRNSPPGDPGAASGRPGRGGAVRPHRGVMKLARDPLLRRPVCAASQPAFIQVSRSIGLSGSDREFPLLTGRSGMRRARRMWSHVTVGASTPRSSSRPSELRITRVFPCFARGFKARASFMLAGCCWWRSLAVDGRSGASRGHPAASGASYPSSEASHDAYAQLALEFAL